jgi:hypothetical protein
MSTVNVPFAWFIGISFGQAVACGASCAGRAAAISGVDSQNSAARFSGYRGSADRAFFSRKSSRREHEPAEKLRRFIFVPLRNLTPHQCLHWT